MGAMGAIGLRGGLGSLNRGTRVQDLLVAINHTSSVQQKLLRLTKKILPLSKRPMLLKVFRMRLQTMKGGESLV